MKNEVYVVAFFKVMQQQIIGEVANSINVCGQIISACNSERTIKIGMLDERRHQRNYR